MKKTLGAYLGGLKFISAREIICALQRGEYISAARCGSIPIYPVCVRPADTINQSFLQPFSIKGLSARRPVMASAESHSLPTQEHALADNLDKILSVSGETVNERERASARAALIVFMRNYSQQYHSFLTVKLDKNNVFNTISSLFFNY